MRHGPLALLEALALLSLSRGGFQHLFFSSASSMGREDTLNTLGEGRGTAVGPESHVECTQRVFAFNPRTREFSKPPPWLAVLCKHSPGEDGCFRSLEEPCLLSAVTAFELASDWPLGITVLGL